MCYNSTQRRHGFHGLARMTNDRHGLDTDFTDWHE